MSRQLPTHERSSLSSLRVFRKSFYIHGKEIATPHCSDKVALTGDYSQELVKYLLLLGMSDEHQL